MRDRESTVKSRTLATALTGALRNKGWTTTRLGEEMGWTVSSTSRFLSGKRGANIVDIATVLGLLDVPEPDRNELLTLGVNPYEQSWCREHGECLPAHVPALRAQEDIARTITTFHPMLVPALLQTPDYARAVLQADSAVPAGAVDSYLTALHERQAIVSRKNAPAMWCLIEHHALTHNGIARETLAGQVRHLELLADRTHIRIRILPADTGTPHGYPQFELLTFTENRHAVYLELLNTTCFLERPDTVDGFVRASSNLRRAALNETESRSWLGRLACSLGDP